MPYYHSVTLDESKCKGCTNCLKRCPTEAIRIRNGKANIITERCIDCGECIKACPHHAKKTVTDDIQIINDFKYKVAIPAPSLYTQFKKTDDVNLILTALKNIGFDDVYEVARAAEVVSVAINQIIPTMEKPVISSACPSIVRLINIRFPNLIEKIVPIHAPMEVAAKFVKKSAAKKMQLDFSEIGVFFITPCPAKATASKSPIGHETSLVDGIFSMKDIYMRMLPSIKSIKKAETLSFAGMSGIGWAKSGGESFSLNIERSISVDGIENAIKILELLEDEQIEGVDFLELNACINGCIGGPLTIENSYISKSKMKAMRNKIKDSCLTRDIIDNPVSIEWSEPIKYSPVLKLDNNLESALEKLNKLEKINASLPGLDCGACGAPACRALAEDIVTGCATESDCIFKLREKISDLVLRMVELENEVPPPFRKNKEN